MLDHTEFTPVSLRELNYVGLKQRTGQIKSCIDTAVQILPCEALPEIHA